MIKKYASLLILILLFSNLSLADRDDHVDVKELYKTGQISSLEVILDKLSSYNIERILEVELQRDNGRYIYEIEYINDKGSVLEIEVDAVTAKVLKTEREY